MVPAATSALNLHALAHTVLDESLSPDPAVMASDFVARIPSERYREALEVLAKDYLRRAIHSQRSTRNGGEPQPGSRKVAAVREAWNRLLGTPEFVPGTGWLFLRDATAEQVRAMAGMRRAKSRELNAAADRYAALASELEQSGVNRVGDLPGETLERLLGDVEDAA